MKYQQISKARSWFKGDNSISMVKYDCKIYFPCYPTTINHGSLSDMFL